MNKKNIKLWIVKWFSHRKQFQPKPKRIPDCSNHSAERGKHLIRCSAQLRSLQMFIGILNVSFQNTKKKPDGKKSSSAVYNRFVYTYFLEFVFQLKCQSISQHSNISHAHHTIHRTTCANMICFCFCFAHLIGNYNQKMFAWKKPYSSAFNQFRFKFGAVSFSFVTFGVLVVAVSWNKKNTLKRSQYGRAWCTLYGSTAQHSRLALEIWNSYATCISAALFLFIWWDKKASIGPFASFGLLNWLDIRSVRKCVHVSERANEYCE